MTDDSKIVLITGCSSGIGLSTAVEFSKNNFVTYPTMRDLSKKQDLEDKFEHSENILQLDVTDEVSIDNAISSLLYGNHFASLLGGLQKITLGCTDQ